MEWYNWIILSVALLVVELITPGTFVSFFLASGALVTGGLVYWNIVNTGWVEWLIFSASALSCFLFFRPQRWGLTGGNALTDRDQIIGDTVKANEQILPQSIGKVTYRGAIWNARNIGPLTIEPETHSVVIKIKGLTLEVSQPPNFSKMTQNI